MKDMERLEKNEKYEKGFNFYLTKIDERNKKEVCENYPHITFYCVRGNHECRPQDLSNIEKKFDESDLPLKLRIERMKNEYFDEEDENEENNFQTLVSRLKKLKKLRNNNKYE